MLPLGASKDVDPVGVVMLALVLALALIGCVYLIIRNVNDVLGKNKTFRARFRSYLGRDFDTFQTHVKKFPGYDLASIHRALTSFREEFCSESIDVGGTNFHTLRDLFENLKQPNSRLKPHTAAFERVPVDVDEEISLASGMVWFATLRQDDAKVAIMLSTTMVGADYDDDFESRRATQKLLMISIACREKATADHFFEQIEQRRRTLSVYRGKVIDPDVHGGGIHGIGFRAIKRVTEENLVLPDSVKKLLHNAIVGFYNHADELRSVGVEMKRGVLFHSPPGTGKTSISLYLAGLLPNFTVCFVSGQKLLYPREICRMARYLQPAMVVFEDIDLVAEERDSNGLATVLGELMNQIDGCDPDEQVLFIMNTNSLQRLEGAVRNRPGRVDQIIDIPLPDADARKRLLHHFARGLGLPDRLSAVLDATDGATPATLKEIVKRATVAAIERGAGNGTGSITLIESELLLATRQVQVMRDTKPTGKMGFV